MSDPIETKTPVKASQRPRHEALAARALNALTLLMKSEDKYVAMKAAELILDHHFKMTRPEIEYVPLETST